LTASDQQWQGFGRVGLVLALLCLAAQAFAANGDAAKGAPPAVAHPDAGLSSAPVEIDGNELFRVRGVPASVVRRDVASASGRVSTGSCVR
jgi:hypothetical protein